MQVFYEFFVFRFQNKTITHAAATAVHFFVDALCCFVTCVFITEVTKFSAGRLRPDFLQVAIPTYPELLINAALLHKTSEAWYGNGLPI